MNGFGSSWLRRDLEAHLDFWAKRPGVHFPHRETKRVREGDKVAVELKVTQNARNIITRHAREIHISQSGWTIG